MKKLRPKRTGRNEEEMAHLQQEIEQLTKQLIDSNQLAEQAQQETRQVQQEIRRSQHKKMQAQKETRQVRRELTEQV